MAIKASAAVTLSAIVDVEAVWRFYKKQSSTLAAPSKPTTFPPSSDWNDTEPTYDPTKTETLYVVECNVFSDGTFEYTKVSKSTAFEAAKAAYNKGVSNTNAIADLDQRTFAKIRETETSIIGTVSNTYYTKDAASSLVSSISTQFEQTEKDFTFLFNQVDGKVVGMQQYIRFENGNIILGKSGNELTLKIQNDRIGFYDGNHEVAYFSNDKLYVTNGEFINSLQLGNFAFYPRPNGNMSFGKVV